MKLLKGFLSFFTGIFFTIIKWYYEIYDTTPHSTLHESPDENGQWRCPPGENHAIILSDNSSKRFQWN